MSGNDGSLNEWPVGDRPADEWPLLDVVDLVVRFPQPRGLGAVIARHAKTMVHAVEGVSFSIRNGEVLALVGESGCGKTTTAHAVLGLVEPYAGSVRLGGNDISRLRPKALRTLRRRAQLVYQDPYESLDPRFTVRQTVEEPLVAHKLGGSSHERHRLVVSALRRVGLTPPELFLGRLPHELSGGQRQRVAIAAALILGPELIVADEPVSMLDVSVRAGILQLLDRLRGDGLGVLFITHDLSTAVRFADRIAVMYLGRIVEEGPPREIVGNPQHPYTKSLISVVPKPNPRSPTKPQILTGEVPDPVRVPSGCRFHPRCPAMMERCSRDDPHELLPAGDVSGHAAACWLVHDAGSFPKQN